MPLPPKSEHQKLTTGRSKKDMAVRKKQTRRRLDRQRPQQPRQHQWHEALAALSDYRKQHGDCRVPSKWPKKRWLASWVERMRSARKRNRLTKAKIQELDQIGFNWSVDFQPAWEQRFKELEAFKREHGHCNVPRSYPLNRQLAYWVDGMRRRKKQGRLDKANIRRLDALGFCWSLLHRRFHRRDLDELVAALTAFKQKHGHCNLIAAHEGVDGDLVSWLKDVRKSKKQGRLDPKYVRRLEKLGFEWEPQKQHSQKMYSALLDYRTRYGDCRVPSQWPENRRLANWVANVRAARRQNTLPQARIQQLDRIGFTWNTDLREKFWEQRFKELKKFTRRHGHCRVPSKYPPAPSLARWASAMRRQKRDGTLAEERIRRLAASGFCWDMSKDRPLRRRKSRKASLRKRDKQKRGGRVPLVKTIHRVQPVAASNAKRLPMPVRLHPIVQAAKFLTTGAGTAKEKLILGGTLIGVARSLPRRLDTGLAGEGQQHLPKALEWRHRPEHGRADGRKHCQQMSHATHQGYGGVGGGN